MYTGVCFDVGSGVSSSVNWGREFRSFRRWGVLLVLSGTRILSGIAVYHNRCLVELDFISTEELCSSSACDIRTP